MPAHSQQPVDTLIFARWIIPVAPSCTPLENHALAIRNGEICATLPASEAENIHADEVLRLNKHALLPGLINTHGHAAMSLFRGMADDKPLHTWLNDHIWPAEGRWVDETFVRDGCELAIAEMLRSGTTTFSDMYFFPETVAGVIRKAGIRAQLSFPIFDFPCAWGSGPDEYFRKGLALRDELKHSSLITVAFGPHAPYTVSDDVIQRVATLAAEADMAIQIHLHETQQEVDDALASSRKRPIKRLAELGLLGPKTQCVHLTALNDEDIATLASFGCHAIHCPESNMKLASGFSPVEKMRSAGINVALGTDGAASNNDLDMFSEMRSAALLGKVVSGDASALPDYYALTMATLNGAKALGLDHLVGSLEVGKQADIIAVDLSNLAQQPVYNPVSQLVYTNLSHEVSHSWILGRKVLDNGQLTTLDSRDIITRAELWRAKISGE
ncbi:5-methylthioadenosine/S-adenosylhomocysteine deaminase [Zhongshania aliphaticivorans]|uniref:5-methylthioadenosine/S-adenosylhomocysteine deaminase n=1 Tax=Zhongshania aliphaticivorans TaxID=1470434 RepID=A0A5S9MP31_9GAMM|nr:TRZ/ATZ family hydrolase [Zhongshania aliphaticivorans]CAA0078239.1 5-methylthioadenosine/S-adenosylhomocysteine deaminase [Zhongshania aliphaticivorans]CAA0086801.1 5-methylthioadenosine/S-adenosylhomocysteine deaminase [Zhongshania aliphaticivorans]